MGKKDKKARKHDSRRPISSQSAPTAPSSPLISKRGWCIIAMGVILCIAGYVVLSKTDPAGQNWASRLSPFLILGGYGAIGFGLYVSGAQSEPSSLPPTQ